MNGADTPDVALRGDADTLRVDAVTKRFGGLRVFEGISLEIPSGKVVGVIGPNGAGKTTLINVICGMLRPSEGQHPAGTAEHQRQILPRR
jgi:branched-chain amino acid transport system ATP-binding protein